MCSTGGLEEPRDRAVLTQKQDKTQELIQHLSKTASFRPRSFSHLLDDFGLGAPKQANQPLDSQLLWGLCLNEHFCRDELCYCSKGRLHESPTHQERAPFRPFEPHSGSLNYTSGFSCNPAEQTQPRSALKDEMSS